ncbi:MAG: hypothetical protein A2X86_19630 [Bdellovibrionales bacterium GWA2_49_15]|nr:MAG: hypothetical protein A2X86_19630 [Bdellovibrionales bacterium GWA2_49_15]HAZ13797.1 hypothetical protein [Bdellovibrionales bacterium]
MKALILHWPVDHSSNDLRIEAVVGFFALPEIPAGSYIILHQGYIDGISKKHTATPASIFLVPDPRPILHRNGVSKNTPAKKQK